jgi:hypothetical protein
MILTQRQLDVLNSVVVDGQTWADNALSEQHVLDKVAKYEADYDVAVLAGGYENRATKEADKVQKELDDWAGDLATAKVKAKTILTKSVKKAFRDYVDPHYLKYSRKVARGNGQQPKPATEVTDYEDALTSNQDTANIEIGNLTTIQACKDYSGMVWPTPPNV